MAVVRRRYWDADCFISHLAKHPDRIAQTGAVMAAAEGGELQIVTSTYTLVEVLKHASGKHPTPDQAAVIEDFFQKSFIIPVQLTRKVAEEARGLYWFEGMDQADAVHAASALAAARSKHGLEQMDTFDTGLHMKSGELTPPIVIAPPNLPEQKALGESYENG